MKQQLGLRLEQLAARRAALLLEGGHDAEVADLTNAVGQLRLLHQCL